MKKSSFAHFTVLSPILTSLLCAGAITLHAAEKAVPSGIPGDFSTMLRPFRPQVERMAGALIAPDATPHFSWGLDAGGRNGAAQSAWQIRVATTKAGLEKPDLWDSGKVSSGETLDIAYAGKPLPEQAPVWWQVRVSDEQGAASDWSEPMRFRTGPKEWTARWIAPYPAKDVPKPWTRREGFLSAPLLGKGPHFIQFDFGAPRKIQSIRLWPVHHQDAGIDIPGFNFPEKFVLEASTDAEFSNPVVLADFSREAHPRMTDRPAEFKFPEVEARYVRLRLLSARKEDRERSRPCPPAVALAEMEVLSGGENLASKAGVSFSNKPFEERQTWKKEYLNDGIPTSVEVNPFPGLEPAPLFRKEFALDGEIESAVATISALGSYQVFANGRRVDDQFLALEWTTDDRELFYQSFDLTDALRNGENAMGIVLADGNFRKRGGWGRDFDASGTRTTFGRRYDALPRLLAQLRVRFKDGREQTIISDNAWKVFRDGPWQMASIRDGILYDARKDPEGWTRPGFNDAGWKAATPEPLPDAGIALVPQMCEPVRITETLATQSMRPWKDGWLIDFGQAIAGTGRLDFKIPEGKEVVLDYYASVNPDNGEPSRHDLAHAQARDRFIGNGRTASFTGDFTYHGFRYLHVTGLPEKPAEGMLSALAIHNDFPRIGALETDNETINRIWRAADWTVRANFVGVPTDCADRDERGAWASEGQLAWHTGVYGFDLAAFGRKWSRDFNLQQEKQGFFGQGAPGSGPLTAGYSSAGIIVPWLNWLYFGDRAQLEAAYPHVVGHIEHVAKMNPDLSGTNYTTGPAYGDWLDIQQTTGPKDTGWLPDGPRGGGRKGIPFDAFAAIFWQHDLKRGEQIAAALGKPDDAAHFLAMRRTAMEAFAKRFAKSDGTFANDAQAVYGLLLGLDLLDDVQATKAVVRLKKAVDAHGKRISGGTNGSLQTIRALSRHGEHALAFDLVARPECPSWGYMIDNGATTIWERFDAWRKEFGGWNPSRMNSSIHTGFAAVGHWIWEQCAGLRPDPAQPGFKHFFIEPKPLPDLKHVKACYNSVRGPIAFEWQAEGEKISLDLSVPPNSAATVIWPDGKRETFKPGKHMLAGSGKL